MLIARWNFKSRFCREDDCISILRKWEIDVGHKIGWRVSSIRLLQGIIGADSEIQLEGRFENLSELETSWRDMEAAPYHKEYMWQLESVTVPGSNKWAVLREIDILPKND